MDDHLVPHRLDDLDYARALERTESTFWWFCDNYVELVKGRAYDTGGGAGTASARLALRTALGSLQRLLAPFLPYATEEAWSWWNDTSIHRAPWPLPVALGGDAELIDPVINVLTHVRRAKTEAQRSQRAEVAVLDVTVVTAEAREALDRGRNDLLAAGSIEAMTVTIGETFACDVELAAV